MKVEPINEDGEEVINRQSIDIKIEALTTAMKSAATENLQPKQEARNKCEPSEETINLIKKTQEEQ